MMSSSTFPLLATKRIVISKDYDFTPESTTTRNVFVTDGQGGGSMQRRQTTTPASSREFTKVKVEFLLKSRENTSLSKWFSDSYKNNEEFSEFAEYLKIYFLALDDSSDAYTAYLQGPEGRYRYLKNLPSYLSALTGVAPIHAASEITFAEVLQNEKFTTTPISDMSSYYEHDIYGELEIDITGLDLDASNRIHLIGFVHLDVDSYVQDKGLDPLPIEPYKFESHGGDMIYDLLLERADSLRVPFYRDSLYLDSSPYYGPAHYHSDENPGPDDYVGWMAGAPGEDMGPKLDLITIRNYKVVSSVYDYADDPSVFGLGPLSSTPIGSTGGTLDSYLNSIIDREELLDESRRIIELTRASSYAESKSGKNFMKASDLSTSFINSTTSQDVDSGVPTSEGSHHASIVGIDYFKLVRDMSNYGDILNFHYYKGNDLLVESFLSKSRILDLTILRDRVTNNPYSFNDADSLDYKIYDIDEPSKKLVNTQDDLTAVRILNRPGDGYKGLLKPASTHFATVKEVNLATVDEGSGIVTSIPGHGRYFYIKDYDLFHNVQFGNYRYSMKLTLIDGVYKTINSILERLEDAYYRVSLYFKEASHPVIKDVNGVYVQGNHDYDVGVFHQSFTQRDHTEMIDSFLNSYSEAVGFLTGEPPVQAIMQQIECAIDPRSTNLDTIEHMCSIMQDLITAISATLKANGDETHPEKLKKKGQTHVPASGPARKSRTIEVTVKCPDIVSALAEGTVVANYSNYQVEDEEGNDFTPDLPNLGLGDFLGRFSTVQGRYRNNLLLPSSYSSLNFTPYRTFQYEVQPLAAAPVRTNNRLQSAIKTSTAPRAVSSYNKFFNSKNSTKNLQTVMINSARSKQNIFSSYMFKPASDIVFESFSSAGVTVNMVGNPMHFGSNPKNKNNTTRAKEKLKDAYQKADENNCLELSDDLKAAIQNAAYNGITRKEVLDTLESSYANLNGIIDIVGDLYDNALGLIGALQDTSTRLSSTFAKAASEEQKFFKDNTPEDRTGNNYGLEKYETYIAEAAELYVLAPGKTPYKFTPNMAANWTMSEMPEETYIIVKAEPTKKEDAIPPVNNGYLLRI